MLLLPSDFLKPVVNAQKHHAITYGSQSQMKGHHKVPFIGGIYFFRQCFSPTALEKTCTFLSVPDKGQLHTLPNIGPVDSGHETKYSGQTPYKHICTERF